MAAVLGLRQSAPSGAHARAPRGGGVTGLPWMLTLEYDGAGFSGWQRQPGRRTVEGVVIEAIHAVTGEAPALTASGRTDAGAHAHGQVAGFSLARDWEPNRLRAALDARLPEDVAVVDLQPAPPGFHARFDAVARTYRYLVAPRTSRRAVGRQYAWLVEGPVDVAAMRAASRVLVGRHDLAAFGRSPRPGGTTERTIQDVEVRLMTMPDAPSVAGAPPGASRAVVVIDVTADAFLYGMMRAIAGALVAVGTGRMTAAALTELVHDGPARRRPHVNAPAHGLHQWRVVYPADAAATTHEAR